MPRLVSSLTAFSCAVCLMPSLALAERYSVEEDSFGGFSAKKVDETAERLESREEPSESIQPIPKVDEPSPQSKPEEAAKKTEKHELLGDVGASLSPFEKEYIENEKREKARVLQAIKGVSSTDAYDATKVDPLDYVDGDELLKNGKQSVSERSRYYTAVDAEGRLSNIDYDPEAVQEALEREKETKIEYTEANILRRSEGGLTLPDTAEPFAVKLLTDNYTTKTYFEEFSNSCCDKLPNIDVTELQLGKSHFFDLNEDQLAYRFAGGDSRFLLLSLPQTKAAQPIRLRSFIRAHKRFAIEHGVFFPQLVTLDKDKKPLRIFTGPLLQYQPETWLAHGFLQGVFQLDASPKGGEKYLLLNTTRDIQRETSNIDDDEGLLSIDHMGIGTLEIQLLLEED